MTAADSRLMITRQVAWTINSACEWHDGERLVCLTARNELTSEACVIADGEGVIGLAGIMGGALTLRLSENGVLRCAEF